MEKDEKITKTKMAEMLGISRPTLDTYLKYGLPKKVKELDLTDYEAIEIEIVHLEANKKEKLVRIKHLNEEILKIDNRISELESLMKEESDNGKDNESTSK